ncbi:MAG: histidine kinase dimerization/phospho-acceptor domain-containing protein [Gammaproteobacteria bacterium]
MVDSTAQTKQSDEQDRQRIERLFALGMIANGLVHEITNPLNAVVMNAELGLVYLEQGIEQDALADILRTIVAETKRAGTLAQSVSEFGRATDHAPNQQSDLNKIITQARQLLGSKLRRRDFKLLLEVDESLPPIPANPLALALALASLIDLALDAGVAQLQITARQQATSLELTLLADRSIVPESRYAKLLLEMAGRVFAAHQAPLSVDEGRRFSVQLPVQT